jgi:hypothetical protein
MRPEELDVLYTSLAQAIARVGEQRASLMLATLALDLIAHQSDPATAAEAIARAERLAGI